MMISSWQSISENKFILSMMDRKSIIDFIDESDL